MRLTGMRAFFIVWAGQFLSRIGSFLTGFALAIWAFDQTKAATSLTTIVFCAWGASIITSLFAGPLVDRWNRKLTMMLSDLLAMASTLVVLLLFVADHLQVWHLYVQAMAIGVGDAFQWPAFSAAMSTMLKQEDYGRAYGLNGLAENATAIFAPPLAAVLLAVITLDKIMLIDFITFLFAIGGVLVVTIPAVRVSPEGKASREGRFRDELTFGWRYIIGRPTLLGLQLIILLYTTFNDLGGGNLSTPMILARTGGDSAAVGITHTAFGIGGVLSGLLLGWKGGFKNRPSGLFLGIFGQCIGIALMGLGRNTWIWALGAFCSSFAVAIGLASNQAFWQSKVPPDIQGKVFAARRMIAQITGPLAVLAAGPLADRVFEPLMAGQSAGSLTWLAGSGAGAGMGLQMFIFGIAGALAGLCGYLFKATREGETLIADHIEPIGAEGTSEGLGAGITVAAE